MYTVHTVLTADEELSAVSLLFVHYNRTEFVHLPIVSLQKLDVADRGEFPPCLVFWT
jgi:hypothetical protein